MAEGVMDKVRLGRTDIMVTSICFGTSGLGDMPDTYGYGVDEARARATLHAIFDGPANFIDTARNYGLGRSEERIGAVIRERGGLPEGFVVSTKLDRDFETNAFDAARARRSLEQSLKALGLDRVDLLHLHDPEHARSFDEATGRDGALGELFRMKEEGLAKAVGPRGRRRLPDDAAAARLGFRRADHPQSLHPRQPQRRRDARSRGLARDRRPQRRALCERRARQGIDRLSALRLSGSFRGHARSDPQDRGDLHAARRAARRGGAAILDARPAHRLDHLRRDQARAGQADARLGALSRFPDDAWTELMALTYATDDPEATRDYKLG